jgi:hypothetical protein
VISGGVHRDAADLLRRLLGTRGNLRTRIDGNKGTRKQQNRSPHDRPPALLDWADGSLCKGCACLDRNGKPDRKLENVK